MTEPCHDEVCITCSDQAVAVTVLRLLDDDMAEVSTSSEASTSGEASTETSTEEVSVALVTAKPGDTILVHAGEAIAVVGS
jgi:hydrogenase expression/formation protein HypC